MTVAHEHCVFSAASAEREPYSISRVRCETIQNHSVDPDRPRTRPCFRQSPPHSSEGGSRHERLDASNVRTPAEAARSHCRPRWRSRLKPSTLPRRADHETLLCGSPSYRMIRILLDKASTRCCVSDPRRCRAICDDSNPLAASPSLSDCGRRLPCRSWIAPKFTRQFLRPKPRACGCRSRAQVSSRLRDGERAPCLIKYPGATILNTATAGHTHSGTWWAKHGFLRVNRVVGKGREPPPPIGIGQQFCCLVYVADRAKSGSRGRQKRAKGARAVHIVSCIRRTPSGLFDRRSGSRCGRSLVHARPISRSTFTHWKLQSSSRILPRGSPPRHLNTTSNPRARSRSCFGGDRASVGGSGSRPLGRAYFSTGTNPKIRAESSEMARVNGIRPYRCNIVDSVASAPASEVAQ